MMQPHGGQLDRVLVAVVQFFGVSQLAGWLLVPCWAWATYILAMNSAIVFMWM